MRLKFILVFIFFIKCTTDIHNVTPIFSQEYQEPISIQYTIDSLLIEIEKTFENSPDYVYDFAFMIYDNSEFSNVPISLVIAQSALESGYGRYAVNNNYFGIKDFKNGKKLKTFEHVNGQKIELYEPFAIHNSLRESIMIHSNLLNNSYSISKNECVYDAIKKLDKYATDSYYKIKLKNIIDKYNLTYFDELNVLENELLSHDILATI